MRAAFPGNQPPPLPKLDETDRPQPRESFRSIDRPLAERGKLAAATRLGIGHIPGFAGFKVINTSLMCQGLDSPAGGNEKTS